MDKLLVLVNILLVLATVILAYITLGYARSTRDIAQKTGEAAGAAKESAQAAKESAQASRELVELERQKMMLAQRPLIRLVREPAFPDYSPLRGILLDNAGRGDAVNVTISTHYTSANKPPVKGTHDIGVIEASRKVRRDIQLPDQQWQDLDELIAVCHYQDNTDTREPRLYHSVFREQMRGKLLDSQRYFPPERPLDQDPDFAQYLSMCKVCKPG
ncbi:MAG: hypothetical protein MUQ56_08295 [Thermoleophilia bacterium]|nr:hypothetical protein [Thermoleophilia bacterium]